MEKDQLLTVYSESDPDNALELCLSTNRIEVRTIGRWRRTQMVRYFGIKEMDFKVDAASSIVDIDGNRYRFDPADALLAESIVTEATNRAARGNASRVAADQPVATNQSAASTPLETNLRRLVSTGNAVQSLSVALGLLGVFGGLVLAFQTDSNGFEETRPYVASGIGIAVSSLFTGLVGYLLGLLAATYGQLQAERVRTTEGDS